MARHLFWPLIAAAVCVFGASILSAAESQDPFEYLYGKEAARVLAGHDPKALAEFAASLLADSDSVITDPDVKTVVRQKACEFGLMSPQGYATAADALRRLAAAVPERDNEWQEKLLQVVQLQFKTAKTDEEKARFGQLLVEQMVKVADLQMATGNAAKAAENCRQAQAMLRLASADRREALQTRIKQLTARAAALLQADRFKAQLQTDPKDKNAAEKLVHLYLVDLDDPDEAAKYGELGADDMARKCLLVANMNPENLPEAALLALTDWYKALADSAAGDPKVAMLHRTETYGNQYLKVHTDADLPRTRVTVLMGHVTADLAAEKAAAEKASADKTAAEKSAAKPPAPRSPRARPGCPFGSTSAARKSPTARRTRGWPTRPIALGRYWGYLIGGNVRHRDDEGVPDLARDERYGDLVYRFDLPNHKYTVHLGFYDDTSKAVGDRLIAIQVLGQTMEKAFDIYKYTNGKHNTLELTIRNCTVVGGYMTVRLTGVKQTAVLCYIEIVSD